jgi:ATP-dependent helicase/nuclease subunit B
MNHILAYSLTDRFIDKVSSFIGEHYIKKGRDLSRLAIVFGGQRPRLFLQKELSKKNKQGFFSPKFFSIDEFIEYILLQSGAFTKRSDLDACFVIYQLAKKHAPSVLEGRHSFSQFLPWAREILAFIEQLDLEEIKIDSLKGIQSQAAIGYDVPESINMLMRHIIVLRDVFHAALMQGHTYTRGLVYLLAKERIAEASCPEFDEIFFCNFFYLHKTEQGIIKNLCDRSKATLFFQGGQDEWPLLAELAADLESPIRPESQPAPSYDLVLHASSDLHSQVCAVREVLKTAGQLDKTVIVLPDTQTVIPLLSEISSVVGDFNVSMGYPAKRSSLYVLFDCIFKAQETKKTGAYYAKDYLHLLTHPLVKNLVLGEDPSVTRILVHKIEEALLGMEKTAIGGSVFVELKEVLAQEAIFESAADMIKRTGSRVSAAALKEILGQLHKFLFSAWEEIASFSDLARSLEQLADLFLRKSFLDRYPLNLKILEKTYAMCDEFESASFAKECFAQEEVFKIFKNTIEREMVSFSGSPLKGLQILGLLETRALSFDHVIILDANESVLPQLKIYEPLIPRDVMISLGINQLEKEEEIQRYQFMRLLASARRVDLFYQQKEDGEKSRFIEELIWRKEKAKNSLKAQPILHSHFKMKVLRRPIEVKKRPPHVDFLKDYQYSASSINTYLSCPLKFYYQYVLGLQEKEDLLDEPEASEVGTFIHGLLEEVFSKFVGKRPKIDSSFTKYFFETLDRRFEAEFKRKMKSDAFLVKEVLDFRMKQFLENEKDRPVEELLGVEKIYEDKIPLAGREVRFKAKIDRIDRMKDNSCLILDYKTGVEAFMPLKMDRLSAMEFTRKSIKDAIKSFQLPVYLRLFEQAERRPCTNAGLYSLRNPVKDSGIKLLFGSDEGEGQRAQKMDLFMKALESIVLEILNPAVSFIADQEDVRACGHCPFSYLCR